MLRVSQLQVAIILNPYRGLSVTLNCLVALLLPLVCRPSPHHIAPLYLGPLRKGTSLYITQMSGW